MAASSRCRPEALGTTSRRAAWSRRSGSWRRRRSAMAVHPPGSLKAGAVAVTGQDAPAATLAILEGPGPRRRLRAMVRPASDVRHQAEAPIRPRCEGLREVGRLGLGHHGSLTRRPLWRCGAGVAGPQANCQGQGLLSSEPLQVDDSPRLIRGEGDGSLTRRADWFARQ
jgi:hypothetical protein